MKVLKKEDMKLVKGGLAAGGPREQLCYNLMQICWAHLGTVGNCVGGYVDCMLPG